MISFSGLVTIQFNRGILIPSNYASFNDSVLLLEVLSASGEHKTLDFTWNITSFTSLQIQI